MRIFSLLGLLLTVLIIGWLSAMFFGSMTAGSAVRIEAVSPAATPRQSASDAPQVRSVPIDKARELVRQDKERQKKMQEALNQ